MNERIQELHKQAVDYALSVCDADGVYQGREYLQVIREKFAELIVQECANFIEPLGDYCGGHGEPREPSTRDCAEKLKQHFGVK